MGRLNKAFSLNEIRQKRANSIQIKLTHDLLQPSLAKRSTKYIIALL